MPKRESPLTHLSEFLPEGSVDEVINYLQQYKVHLTITRDRKSILGNFRSRALNKNHQVTVNGSLNRYSFLITLLHELAHLLAYEKYGHRIQPHGVEWKKEFGEILKQFIPRKVFPSDVEHSLYRNLNNQGASSCADVHLARVLRKYDEIKQDILFVEQLAEGSLFKIKGGRIFKKGERIRKRFRCEEVATGKVYLFSPVYEVKPVQTVT